MRISLLVLFILCSFPFISSGQAPVANFILDKDTGCSPLIVSFTNTSTGTSIPTTYSWTFGTPGGNSSIASPQYTYTATGTYTVTLTVSNANGTSTKTLAGAVTILPSPTVSFSGTPLTGCPPLAVNFTDNSNPMMAGPTTYEWNFGNGVQSTTQNPNYTYAASGVYGVTLKVTNSGGCVTSVTVPQYITVHQPPTVNFTFTPVCKAPGTTTFTTTVTGSGPYTYSWNFGDGTFGTTNNPSHTYALSGTYTVAFTVTDANGCATTVTKQVGVGALKAGFNAPASACVGTPVNFVNTSVAAGSYLWFFGDGQSAIGFTPTHSYSAPNVYNVMLIATDPTGLCPDTLIKPITINPGPLPNFTIFPAIPCPSPDTLFFTNLTVGGVSYSWDFGDGTQGSTSTNTSHIYNKDTIFNISLTATDINGCSNTISKLDTFFKIFAKITPPSYDHCAPSTVPFSISLSSSSTTQLPITITSANWDFGDGSPISNSLTPSHTYINPGIYYITLSATTSNGCSFTDTAQVYFGVKPVANITIVDDTVCLDDFVTITNQSVGGVRYEWYIYTGSNDWSRDAQTYPSAPDLTLPYNFPGVFTVTMVASDRGCNDTVTSTDKIVVQPPKSVIDFIVDCDTPTLVQFGDSSLGNITSRLWDFGDGTTDTSKNPKHHYSSLGTYLVSLSLSSTETGCSHTAYASLLLYVPTADIIATDTVLCVGDSILFTPTFNPNQIATWVVTAPGSIGRPTGHKLYANGGKYSVFLEFWDIHGCKHDTTKTNYIFVADPTPMFTASPYVGCAPFLTTLTETSTNTPGAYTTNWDWDFGDGTTANLTTGTTTHTYQPGLYTVTVKITDNIGCVDSFEIKNYIEARVTTAGFTADDDDTTGCLGDKFEFTNTSTSSTNAPLTYTWDFGDGSPTDNSKNPDHIYNQAGFFTVTLIVTDNAGCADTLVRTNYIEIAQPTASFIASDTFSLCPPLSVSFTSTSVGATSYKWLFGDGGNSTLANPFNIYSAPGIYTVKLVATNSYGCSDTAYGTVSILGYAGGLTYTPLKGCNPLAVNFTANLMNVSNFLWDFSDGVIQPATGSTVSHTYATAGKYLPKILFTDSAGCVNSSDGIDTIIVDDVVGNFVTSPACINTPVTFIDTSHSYYSALAGAIWNINNGQFSSNQHKPTFTFTTPGTYPVTLITSNAAGCRDTINEFITIHPLPTVLAGLDTTVCLGDAAILSASGANTYTWDPPTALTCVACQTTHASPAVTTNYVVVGTDGNGCKNKDTVKVSIKTITTSIAGSGGEICLDSSIQLGASGAEHYEWKPAAGLDHPDIANPIASPTATTTYIVLAYEGSCLPDTNEVKVVVHPLPTVYAGTDETIVVGNMVNLNANGTLINTYLWSPATSLNCEACSSPIAKPTSTTTYTVTVSTIHGCRASDEVTINVLCDQSQLFIPNTFSPNGDGENDVFYPRGVGIKNIQSFRIYNRWGELVYERKNIMLNDAASAWEGTFKGNTMNPDVFVYVVEAICDGGELMTWKGDVSLIR